ncbi:hypothetical protein G9U51_03675 [Calidifontibacter sp. DB0510]|uniref:PKD domain-containing protein n=1 Tax=Metallococcus carri TaxID=1656884 RepID=A0A967AZZ3_9MICO|nr:hypothetical protein [Metallococcus carri]NHN54883.1 hypothetical protein [Metallococcus carri]NOP37228.1 hypothetical protein [Calidifontibacter sp. DB2511S]
MRTRVAAMGASLAVAIIASPQAIASPGLPNLCGVNRCGFGGGGVYVGLSEAQTRALPPKGSGTINRGGKPVRVTAPYEYQTVLECPGNAPGAGGNDNGCTQAYTRCASVPNAEGPYSRIYRRLTDPATGVGPPDESWDFVNRTCWPTLVPNNTGKPQLTLSMIKAQWTRTPFAKPTLVIQPPNGRTLITLPTYFQQAFSVTGYQPDEVRSVTLLGRQVRIKPTFKANVFDFGDGTSYGPTKSVGGPYPTGDVTHAYTAKGTVSVRVTTTYGGQYSVDGGPWTDIPGTVNIVGPAQQLQVLTSRNELVNQ